MFSINKKMTPRKNVLTIHTFVTYLTNIALMGSISLFASPAYALFAAADTGNSYPGVGYGAQVLDIVLDTWQNPDPNAKGVTSVIIRIAKDGRPFSCEIRRSSSSQIADTSICDAVAQIGSFPAPFGAQNSEIILTFVYDKSTQNAPQSTPQDIAQNNQNNSMDPNSNADAQIPHSPMTTPMPTPTTSQNIENNLRPDANSAPPANLSAPQTDPRAIAHPTTTPNNSLPNTGSSLIMSPATPSNAVAPQANIPHGPAQERINKLHASSVNTPQQNKDILRITREEPAAPPSNDLTSSTEAMQEYSQGIFNQARTLLKIPAIPSGTYKSTVRVNISPEGALSSTSIQTSSGKKEIDNEILRVLEERVDYPPTPQKDQQSIWLTFTIQI